MTFGCWCFKEWHLKPLLNKAWIIGHYFSISVSSIFFAYPRWTTLEGKPLKSSKNPEKYRGEIEFKLTFTVKSKTEETGFFKKRSPSFRTFAHSVGKYLSICFITNSKLLVSDCIPFRSSVVNNTF